MISSTITRASKTFSKISLLQNLFQASAWVSAEYVLSHIIRFSTNLVLTRLMAPEVFGLMQLIQASLQGVEMLSDMGIHINIVQSPRGEEKYFLRTAWTVAIFRSCFLWLLLLSLTIPVSSIYSDSRFMLFLPCAGLSLVIGGFCSTNLFLYERQLRFGYLTCINIVSQIINISTCIALALWWRADPWALILGSLAGNSIRVVLSHLLPGIRMRFHWNSSAVKEIITFGSWILVSSILGFMISQGDRLILGATFSKSDLGFYGIATALASLSISLIRAIGSKVLIPFYAHLYREPFSQRERLKQIFGVRSKIALLGLIPLFTLIIFSKPIINFLYPPAYQDVAWMLAIIASGMTVNTVTMTIGPILLAQGNSYGNMLNMAFRIVIQLTLMTLGYQYSGLIGMLIGLSSSELFTYPILIWLTRRYNCWQPKLDFLIFAVSFIVISIAYGIL